MDNGKQITNEGFIELDGFEINCFVLRDGTRVLSGREMQRAMKMVDEESQNQNSGARLQRYLDQKTLKPFIFNEKEEGHFNPIICYRGKQRINGYEATILVDLCDAFLEARNNINLSQRQRIIADQCEILMRSFAKVGIIALIDEATGYQYERENDALREIHKKFIAEELQPYAPQFENKFYKEIFRLRGWPYTVKQIKYGQRPSIIGKWTKKYIYGGLPKGILEVLLSKTPRGDDGRLKHKLFQHLTKKDGLDALNKQLTEVTLMLELADSWTQFEKLWNKKYGQQELPFLEYSILEPKKTNRELSDFDQKLNKAISYNPKDKS